MLFPPKGEWRSYGGDAAFAQSGTVSRNDTVSFDIGGLETRLRPARPAAYGPARKTGPPEGRPQPGETT